MPIANCCEHEGLIGRSNDLRHVESTIFFCCYCGNQMFLVMATEFFVCGNETSGFSAAWLWELNPWLTRPKIRLLRPKIWLLQLSSTHRDII